MAVEARHVNPFLPQLLTNRDFPLINQANVNAQMDSGAPIIAPMQEQQQQLSLVYQSFLCDPNSAKTSISKADSGLTYNIPAAATTRKRPRDYSSFTSFDARLAVSPFEKPKFAPFDSLLDQQIISQIHHQHQQEIDRFLAQHTEKLRVEMEETRRRQTRMVMAAIQEGVMKKLKAKEEEILRMGKLNWMLQERIKSLQMENQIWRDLAHTNEATANSLRSDLEQVLAQVSEDRHMSGGGGVADDADSSCGSSDHGRVREGETSAGGGGPSVLGVGKRMCKRCGERESSVLLLPCRHLCLCTMCGSTLVGTCPVCDSVMNASVHVNIS